VFALELTACWRAWVVALATPLHRRLAWRLPHVVLGLLWARGRRTLASWWRAADIGDRSRSYDYFLDSVGRKTTAVAVVVFALLRNRLDTGEEPLLLALDDTPTKRYGPRVQGAGIHHNPTPGPVGSKFLYGHSWVVLSRVVHHPQCGTIGLPFWGRLYIRAGDLPQLPPSVPWTFRTKPRIAAEMITLIGSLVTAPDKKLWMAVDGSYANREFLEPAQRAGFVVVARLRCDAGLYDLPPVLPPGERRGRGRPPIYGKNRIHLAERAAPAAGWQTIEVVTTAGRVVTKRVQSFLATWHPAGGVIRVVILLEEDGSWRAYLCTDPEASVEAIVQATMDRWSIEKDQSHYTSRQRWCGARTSDYHRRRGAA
jgi:hypothetical protein